MTEQRLKYILRLDNNMLKAFDRSAIQSKLDSGEFHPQNYIFDINRKEWLRPLDLSEEFQFKIATDGLYFEKPSFIPPPPPTKNYSEDEYQKVTQDLEKIKHELDVKQGVVHALKSTREELKNDFDKISIENLGLREELLNHKDQEQTVREDLIQARTQNDELENQITNLEKQIEDLLLIKDELFELKDELVVKQEELQAQLTGSEFSFSSMKAENEKLQFDMNELMLENEKIKKKMSIYKDYVTTEKKRANDFESNITKLNEGIVKLKSLRQKDQNKILNLENYKKTQANKEVRELNRLIGDSFEIDNSPQWFIEVDGEVKGPFSFHDLKSLQKFNKIDEDTPVKKRSATFWTTVGQDFEMSANLITHSENRDGKEIFRYFVNRSDYRAPFHGPATIQINGYEFSGFCTSLSSGGAFIELPELDREVMQSGEPASIRLCAGTLSQDFEAEVIQRNFSDNQPCGIGLEFKDLDEDQKNIILDYVCSYLENSKKTA